MQRKYIVTNRKIKESIELAESLWYKPMNNINCYTNCTDILILSDDWKYSYTQMSQQSLVKSIYYKEVKLPTKKLVTWKQYIVINDKPIEPILKYLDSCWCKPPSTWIKNWGAITNILFVNSNYNYYYVTNDLDRLKETKHYTELIIPEILEEETILNTNTNTTMNTFDKLQEEEFFGDKGNVKAIKEMKAKLSKATSTIDLAIVNLNKMKDKSCKLSNPFNTALDQNNFDSIAKMLKDYAPLIVYIEEYLGGTISTIGKDTKGVDKTKSVKEFFNL